MSYHDIYQLDTVDINCTFFSHTRIKIMQDAYELTLWYYIFK